MISIRPGRRREPEQEKIKNRPSPRTNTRNKLVAFYIIMLLAFAILVARLLKISLEDGDRYKKIVLSQQTYNSTTLPYRRGSIEDRNGITLAHSIQVYNIILDSKEMNLNSEQIEPTLAALKTCFGLESADIRTYIRENPTNAYHILLKQVTYDQIRIYQEMVEAEDSNICKNGIWFEENYMREYPNGSLAADVIGFTTRDDRGQYGLEEYYDSTLSGVDGRTYGYRTDDYGMEYTVIPATNGYSLITSIDSYVQQVCEKNILEFNQEHAGEYREGEDGSDNTAVIVMDIDSGEVIAMASYPFFNLNDPYDISAYYTDEQIALMQDDSTYMDTLNNLWKNFCISQSYEPGSVNKTFTVSAGLDSASIHDGDTYYCNGYITLGDGSDAATIRCHNRYGEGQLTVKGAVEQSCNVSLVQIGRRIGSATLIKYLTDFNFGLKTNVDLAGEMRTDSLVFNENTMGLTELATSSFGQGYNVTMIQNISAFCAVINGGYYYRPHLVTKIVDDNGATIENIEPMLLRQPISETTSAYLREYCLGVVENGTGKYSRPYGYRIGGKTGTAEHSGEGKIDYVVSFMGFAPYDDPQIAIYVVIDRPNVASQDTATRYACIICRNILTDILPYMNIYMTEELSESEKKELEERGARILSEAEASLSDNSVSVNEPSEPEENTDSVPEDMERNDIVIDRNTGYAIDPLNGEYLDPVTGVPINGNTSIMQNSNGESIGFEVIEIPEGDE